MTEPIFRNLIVQRPGHRTGKTIGLSPTGEHVTEQPTFKRSELADPAFVQEHQAEIELAMKTGRVINDVDAAPPSSVREWLGRTLPEQPATSAIPPAAPDRASVDLSAPSSEQAIPQLKPWTMSPRQRMALAAFYMGQGK